MALETVLSSAPPAVQWVVVMTRRRVGGRLVTAFAWESWLFDAEFVDGGLRFLPLRPPQPCQASSMQVSKQIGAHPIQHSHLLRRLQGQHGQGCEGCTHITGKDGIPKCLGLTSVLCK
jgi:hypothetical protein